MFLLGMRGCGTDMTPLGVRVAMAGMASAMHPQRYFLYCSLMFENPILPHGQNLLRSVLGDSAIADQDDGGVLWPSVDEVLEQLQARISGLAFCMASRVAMNLVKLCN